MNVHNSCVGKSRSAFLDDISLTTGATIRHTNCQFLIVANKTTRCTACTQYRPTLVVQRQRSLQAVANGSTHTGPSSHVNLRYNNNIK